MRCWLAHRLALASSPAGGLGHRHGGREGQGGEMANAGDRQRVGTGLRVGAAVRRGEGPDIFDRRLCSALAMTRAVCSWLALSCSAAFALSRAICSWLILS